MLAARAACRLALDRIEEACDLVDQRHAEYDERWADYCTVRDAYLERYDAALGRRPVGTDPTGSG